MNALRLVSLVAVIALATAVHAPLALADEVDDILGTGDEPAEDAKKKDDATAKALDKDAEKGLKKADEDVVALQPRPFLRAGRFEIGPWLAFSTNDPYLNHTGLGLVLEFHLTEALSVGVRGLYYFANKSNVIRETVRLQAVPLINAYVGTVALTFHYIPFYGKFAFFGRTVHNWDIYLGGGVGLQFNQVLLAPTFTVRGDLSGVGQSISVNVGMGARLYLTDFLAVYTDLRDYFAFINPEDREGEQPAFFAQNLLFGFGFTLFIPPTFKRKEEVF